MSYKDDLFNLVLQLQNEIKNLKLSSPKQNTTRLNTPNTMQENCKQFTTNKYCWTHEAYAFTSAKCKTPRPGQKTDATFKINMGIAQIFAFLSNDGVGLMKIMYKKQTNKHAYFQCNTTICDDKNKCYILNNFHL